MWPRLGRYRNWTKYLDYLEIFWFELRDHSSPSVTPSGEKCHLFILRNTPSEQVLFCVRIIRSNQILRIVNNRNSDKGICPVKYAMPSFSCQTNPPRLCIRICLYIIYQKYIRKRDKSGVGKNPLPRGKQACWFMRSSWLNVATVVARGHRVLHPRLYVIPHALLITVNAIGRIEYDRGYAQFA